VRSFPILRIGAFILGIPVLTEQVLNRNIHYIIHLSFPPISWRTGDQVSAADLVYPMLLIRNEDSAVGAYRAKSTTIHISSI